MWRATIGELGTLTPCPAITGLMATGTISAGPAFIAATTMAAPFVRAGRDHRSARSGTAAAPPLPEGPLDRPDRLASLAGEFRRANIERRHPPRGDSIILSSPCSKNIPLRRLLETPLVIPPS